MTQKLRLIEEKKIFNVDKKKFFTSENVFYLQVFSEGDSVNCGNSAKRSSEAVWYCYYDAFGNDEIKPLNTL